MSQQEEQVQNNEIEQKNNKSKKKKNKKKKDDMDDFDQILKEALKDQNVSEQIQTKIDVTGPIGGNSNDLQGEFLKSRSQDNSTFRCLGNWREYPQDYQDEFKQTIPPSIPIINQFLGREFPQNETQEYNLNNAYRTSSQEMKEKQVDYQKQLYNLRKAAETHRQVRKYAQQIIRPGKKLIDLCDKIEDMNRYLIQADKLKAGIAFPTGCSLNNVAAHYTPNTGDLQTIEYNDVCKIDFGCQIEGQIIDCAFTVAFDPKYDSLLEAVKGIII